MAIFSVLLLQKMTILQKNDDSAVHNTFLHHNRSITFFRNIVSPFLHWLAAAPFAAFYPRSMQNLAVHYLILPILPLPA